MNNERASTVTLKSTKFIDSKKKKGTLVTILITITTYVHN